MIAYCDISDILWKFEPDEKVENNHKALAKGRLTSDLVPVSIDRYGGDRARFNEQIVIFQLQQSTI